MQELRRIFESLDFTNVETVIASGNVVFETPEKKARALEQTIEDRLEAELGYRVATFLRTTSELAAVARDCPFEAAGATVYAGFLQAKPKLAVQTALEALATDNDEARIGTREVYWRRHAQAKESELFGKLLGKALGVETTFRNMTTVRRIADKYCS
jgi:uncharacterized protein (DUF1697 family)